MMRSHTWVKGRPSFGCKVCGFQPVDTDDLYDPCPRIEEPETYGALAQREYDEDKKEEAERLADNTWRIGTEEPATYEAEEASLGACGCIDYHMNDCPIRTGSR